ncbi:putative two component sensor kinase [Streptomyces scabiei 87.22]|uniref:histidine kinase n=12 Tax=Streptomyces TaxID=1883 RepID=C9YZ97_STRSW|nr:MULTISPECIES: HAMP domain-containing sensor histidine kinase [Streptomyces]MBP5885420.1 HAMP domain-containing histidine kinase [Streptomyces sp. LBUM 1487]MDW8474933.1 HAMP domain-containing sensor histidine kinase [Streptomyces scabiei]MDX2577346.1 HAMP domain-containing sensor histidine kinase [Streptomyces scabiei]MDX2657169.1 HAMP domain-containing sensor histidine kinase [Streptomyces scabiei]MDX2719968.1 HAMP domain-containing sensor histidine kinase [Streptomyces scabiei]
MPPRPVRALSRLLSRLRPVPSLRATFTVSFVAVACVVTVLVGILSYSAAARLVRVDEQTVFSEVVRDLRELVEQDRLTPEDFAPSGSGGPRDDLIRSGRTDVQVLGPHGEILEEGAPGLPVRDEDRRTADGALPGVMVEHGEVEVGDDRYRVVTVALGGGRGAVQVAQEFSDTEDLLRELQQRTLLFVSGIVISAGLFGWWLARRQTRRLVQLAGAAEDVARTGQLGIQVPVAGRDEVGRLGRSFDRMLVRLAQSEEDQRRLVQDAGHELRTPLTSLRTNISLLRRIDELPPRVRAELVDDLSQEALELTDLVNELVDLAAGQSSTEPVQRVDLADLAEEVAGTARRRTGREVVVRVAGDTTVEGRAGALQRAISNLVENAAKFDRAGSGAIVVVVARGSAGSLGELGGLEELGQGGGPGGLRGLGGAAGPGAFGEPGGVRGSGGARDTGGARVSGGARDVGGGREAGGGPEVVRVEVLDRGPGVPDCDLERIFDRFYRAPDARSLPGSGLGLSIVRAVAAAHGGAPFAFRREGGGLVTGFTVRGAGE